MNRLKKELVKKGFRIQEEDYNPYRNYHFEGLEINIHDGEVYFTEYWNVVECKYRLDRSGAVYACDDLSKEEKVYPEDKEVVATYCLSNTAGLEILDIDDCEETVTVRPVVADNPNFGAVETCPIKIFWPGDPGYDEDRGEEVYAGFIWGKMFIPFAECIKA